MRLHDLRSLHAGITHTWGDRTAWPECGACEDRRLPSCACACNSMIAILKENCGLQSGGDHVDVLTPHVLRLEFLSLSLQLGGDWNQPPLLSALIFFYLI